VYRTDHEFLAFVDESGTTFHVIWSRELSGSLQTIRAPGPTGLVVLLVNRGSDGARSVLALRSTGSTVRSAIAGHPSGTLSGTEGASLDAQGFYLRSPDRLHIGSVAYRWVISYAWNGDIYVRASKVRAPDYPSGQYPSPNALVRTRRGDLILLRLEVAATEQDRETGLMNRKSLDADSGMIFVWPTETHDSFWMENTLIPLTVAFLGQDGTVQETQDMAPMTTTLHTPALPYYYAIEANQGFFAANGIAAGDRFQLNLGPLNSP
jgi:uncharacterized membrane protein (UPF0127 family)